jgi:radical SAM superfamily enzyme YgiQ (UPF0313 family)
MLRELVDYCKREGLGLFYGDMPIHGDQVPEVAWDGKQYDWKSYLDALKKEGATMITLSTETFDEDILNELKEGIASNGIKNVDDVTAKFKDHFGKTPYVMMAWLSHQNFPILYRFYAFTPWWTEYLDQIEQNPLHEEKRTHRQDSKRYT